ncbi:1D-myo-inositol 2-acetamido-2-deoxy-alpha-D-glucopyranoside deacetylase [Methylorubrum suomiense]|uniref:1D-myo-inositol 2-acetamido-2-deoxy-alpha-D-glucopyranoside deacetylase n=2 Tax=Methylorubrum suomiense TaxID=144191 RepID=A0ABQ4UQ69_9HYPH|nr:1D-myo-inositol 2-acetamido-2-deoxy-alpha-D-glucopyranoside deacetylase [Methylorubrum suomiense]
MPIALAISPHLDDAAFSAGGTLARLAAQGWQVVMVTVFTASVANPEGFALACQLDKGLPPEIDYMALRRAEDVRAAEALGIEAPVHLPFREAPHRGYGSAPELFAELRPDDSVGLNLADAFERLVADTRPDLILAPQAVGGHVDHVQVVRAFRGAQPPLPVLWWRDFPYTVRDARPKEPLRALFEAHPERAVRLDAEAERRKAASCAAYASQIGFQFGGPEGLSGRLAAEEGTERFRVQGRLPDGILD